MKTLQEYIDYYQANGDKPATHKKIVEDFQTLMEADRELYEHRLHIEQHCLGMGCRSFSWMWKLLVDALPNGFSALEIGVHVGQAISLVELLAARTGKDCHIVGVSPFDGREVGNYHDDYRPLVYALFDKFNLRHPELVRGDSTDPNTIDEIAKHRYNPFDVVYIDGSHIHENVISDIMNYGTMVGIGGWLLMDDSANRFRMPPCDGKINYFHGIEPVSQAVDKLLPPYGSGVLANGVRFKQQFVCMHIRGFQRAA